MAKKGKNSITILHEDEDLVIVQKPANYLSIPDRFDAEKPNLYHYLQKNMVVFLSFIDWIKKRVD